MRNTPHRYGALRRFVNALGIAAVLATAPVMAAGGAGAGGAEPALVILGDSLTAGLGLAREAAFPARLQAALRADGIAVRVIDAGVSGDTSAGGLSRLSWTLQGAPGAVAAIVELGANDGLRGIDPRTTETNLDAIVAALKRRGLAVLLTGMRAPPNLGPEYGAEFQGLFPRLAERRGVRLYPFFLEGVAAVPELNQEDTIHPNEKGVAVVVERILPHVKEMLKGRIP